MLVIATTILEEALLLLVLAAAWVFIVSSIDRYFKDQEQAPARLPRVDIAFEKVWVPDGETTDEISKDKTEGAGTVGHYSYRAITTSFACPC